MAHETHGFVQKFKNLWQAGRNASLTNKSSAGKAQVELSVELGEATPVAAHGSHQKMHNLSRNGPARQRRREKRAAERKAAAGTDVAVEATKAKGKDATKGEESASDEIVIKIEDQDSKVNDAEEVFVNFESGDCDIYDLVILPKTVRLKKHMIIMKTSSERVLRNTISLKLNKFIRWEQLQITIQLKEHI